MGKENLFSIREWAVKTANELVDAIGETEL
jgi:hypothetical protein